MKTIIYMVRHAESPFVFGHERTRGLSEQGMNDAKRIPNLFVNLNIDAVFSSPYTRAVQTVQFLAESKGLQITEHEELKERPIKGLGYKVTEDELIKAIEQSFIDKEFCLAGGESTKTAQERAIPLIERLINEFEGKEVVIGTHGNIMTIIMNYYNNDEYGFDFWQSTSKPDVYKLTFKRNELENVERIW
ncbi:histidine phosphatase family protein [Cohnella sp.]|uniref:histidine phosphatase family protein n=1 Tax=Cohnella sp. TaxID=1883426 RepID=UPI0035645A5D